MLGVCGQVLVVGGDSVREPWGCPMADTARTVSATDPPQGTADPISEAGGTFVKTYLRKGRMLHRQWWSEGKKV